MEFFFPFTPQLSALALLLVCSAFFSGSEASLFYLGRDDRRAMRLGSRGERLATDLLAAPERLLTAILFWNLLVNLAYFAVTSVVALMLERRGDRAEAGLLSVGALLTIILLGEMLPKNIAVLQPRLVASLVSYPLGLAVRALDPFMPVVRVAILASRRLLVPRLQREPYLELGDLERAISLGTHDEKLAQHEHAVLQNIIALDNIRVEEIMQPRLQFELFRPPVHLSHLRGRIPTSGYLFITERHSDEIASALPLKYLSEIPTQHLEHYAEKVVYVPWAASIANVLEQLLQQDRRVAAVIDEHGGTIGIATMDDILESVIRRESDNGDSSGRHASIVERDDGTWIVTGMTPLRRLSKQLGLPFPDTKSVTVAGMVHEQLQHLPRPGDVIEWAGFKITVVRAPTRGRLTVRIEKATQKEQS